MPVANAARQTGGLNHALRLYQQAATTEVTSAAALPGSADPGECVETARTWLSYLEAAVWRV